MSPPRRTREQEIQIFWSRVAITANPDKCWEWQGAVSGAGYGTMSWQRHQTSTHRIAFELHNGRCAALLVLHSCDNRICVNPTHLREGTQKENLRDMHERNRRVYPRGMDCHNTKLSEADLAEIRDLAVRGYTQTAIAQQFNVAASHISRIVTGGYRRAVQT